MERRYSTLHTIGVVLKVLAVIVILLALLLVAFTVVSVAMSRDAISSGGSMGYNLGGLATYAGILTLIPILVGGLGGSLSLYILGDVLCLLVDLEQNTRSTAVLLEHLIKRQRDDGR